MKKLMIAAAVAAMIGGAYADMAYDFTASVKTTKAKQGSATTKTVKVGQDAQGNWWYNDSVFSDTGDGYKAYTSGQSGTLYLKALKINKSTGVCTLQTGKLDNAGKADLAADLETTYCIPEYYKGKSKWCATWTYKVEGHCIRAKGSETIKAHYTIADCCIDADTASVFTQETTDDTPIGDITFTTFYRFGGVIGSKCSNVEVVGVIGNEGIGLDTSAAKTYTTIPAFAIAGQGTWSDTQKDSTKTVVPGIASVSGNIVGIWYEAQCEVCCGNDASSLAYSCDLAQHNINGYTDADGLMGDDSYQGLVDLANEQQWGTAAFGTFTLKFNSKNSL